MVKATNCGNTQQQIHRATTRQCWFTQEGETVPKFHTRCPKHNDLTYKSSKSNIYKKFDYQTLDKISFSLIVLNHPKISRADKLIAFSATGKLHYTLET